MIIETTRSSSGMPRQRMSAAPPGTARRRDPAPRGRVVGCLLAASMLVGATAHAEPSMEERMRALEEQLQRTTEQLRAQQRQTEAARKEIDSLRTELRSVQHGVAAAPAAPAGGAPATATAAAPAAPSGGPSTSERVATLEQRVDEMKPATDWAKKLIGKFKLGTLVYADWAYYAKTGFGPQFLTQINPPGPGNDNYNSFDITRTYINLFFSPTEDFTLRLTPNIYRSVGGANQKLGKTGGVGTNLDGNLNFRLKYGYLDWNTPFAWLADRLPALDPVRKDKITFGQQPNPLIAWEEDLYGYRFTSLTPWNYTSLSSSQAGIAMHGPVEFAGRQYLDWDAGVYNNASFHAAEQSETKSGMGRVSVYPFGAASRFQGLGITGFYQYGYPNKTPDSGTQDHVSRLAALVHYTGDGWGVAGEYDQGHNAFTSGNLFSGSGPADEFGFGPTKYHDFDVLVQGLQNNPHTTQQGFAFFGHVDIPRTPLTLFAMFQQFQPNTGVPTNPVDFNRIVAGLGYRYNDYLRFALTSQTLDYYQSQFDFPLAEAQQLGVKGLTHNVQNAVPDGIQAVFLNLEFNY